jgi:hypothetical protein
LLSSLLSPTAALLLGLLLGLGWREGLFGSDSGGWLEPLRSSGAMRLLFLLVSGSFLV